MKKNTGIALVSVLLVTFAIMIIGMGTLMLTNSNLMVSQNLVSHSIARTNAEAGIDAVLVALRAEVAATDRLPSSMPQPEVRLPGGESVAYSLVREPVWDGNIALIEVQGIGPRNARYVSEAVVEFTSDGVSSGVRPFVGMVQACDSVSLSGSGVIDSFDSRVGTYSEGTRGRSAHTRLLGQNGFVELRGNAPIFGNVYSTGSLVATGSSAVHGDIHATGNIQMRASTSYAGNVTTAGGLEISNSARIAGSVSANGNVRITNAATINGNATAGGNIEMTNSAAKIRQNALAGGTVSMSQWHQQVDGNIIENGNPAPNPGVPPQDCDPIDLPSMMSSFDGLSTDNTTLSAGWPTTRFRITPESVMHFDERYNVDRWTVASGFTPQQAYVFGPAQPSSVYRFREVDFASNGILEISGGDVVMVVDGNFKLAGAASLHIAADSSLTLFVTGTTELTGGYSMTNYEVLNTDGVPRFAVYSAHGQNESWTSTGVKLAGAGKMSATVYAPFTRLQIAGSGELFGSVLAKEVDVSGGSGIHYDVALAEVEISSGGGEVAGESTVRLLSRR